MDADESPICATDGALRAVASPFQYFHQNILEAFRSLLSLKNLTLSANAP